MYVEAYGISWSSKCDGGCRHHDRKYQFPQIKKPKNAVSTGNDDLPVLSQRMQAVWRSKHDACSLTFEYPQHKRPIGLEHMNPVVHQYAQKSLTSF